MEGLARDSVSLRPGSRAIGRYALHDVIARGGMATIHIGTLVGAVGFSRTVAIKRLHEGFAQDPDFVAMLLDEARLAGRILHPNVVSTVDVVTEDGEVFLVMDYVPGESVGTLVKMLAAKGELVPLRILASIAIGALSGLHAAHEARNERGEPLKIVHRDMSPQNILLGEDGVARVIDFGVAKAAARIQVTQDGQVKGKLRYMAPEQVTGAELTRAIDVYASGIMLWELSTGLRLRDGENAAQLALAILTEGILPPAEALAQKGIALDETQEKYLPELAAVIAKATEMAPEDRYATAKDMARDLAKRLPVATAAEVADWLESVAGAELAARAQVVARLERESADASGEQRPSQVMRALSASRPDPVEVAIAGAMSSGLVRPRKTPTPVPPKTATPAPPPLLAAEPTAPTGPTAGQKTLVLAAILLCLSALFLWLARASGPGPKLPDAKAAMPGPSIVQPLAPVVSVASTTAEAPLLPAPIVSASAEVEPPKKAPPPVAHPVPKAPCQPFVYDDRGVKHYDPKCLK